MSIDPRQLAALSAVVEEGGFEKAARRLALTQPAVSQRIRQLESSLGCVLLVRQTPPALTPDGQRLMRYYRQIEHLQQEIRQEFGESRQRRIAIAVNADTLATWLLPVLNPLLESGDWRLDVQVDDQDRTHDLLRKGDVIGCVSASSQPIAGCHCLELGIMVYRCLVSPAFRQKHFKAGISKTSMAAAPRLEYNENDQLQHTYLKENFGLEATGAAHRIPSTESFLSFIAAGHGWGMVPDLQAASMLAAGTVEELIPDRPLNIPLYWHIWDLKTGLSRQLTHAITDGARNSLLQHQKP